MEANNCPFNISSGEETVIFHLKLSFACLGILTCIVAALSLVPKCGLLLFRIVFYAMIANGLEITLQLAVLFPVHNVNGDNILRNTSRWDLACKSLGFLEQVTAWMGHLCVTWVIVYMIYLFVKKQRVVAAHHSKEEIAGLAVCFLLPFLFNWVPFINDYYGFSGIYCWIKITANKNCYIGEALAYMISMYYGPLLLFVVFNLLSCIFLVFGYFCNPKYHSKEILFVLVYPFCYGVVFIVIAASRIQSILEIKHDRSQSSGWWMAHTVADTIRIISPSVLVSVSVSCNSLIMKYKAKRTSKDNERKELINSVQA